MKNIIIFSFAILALLIFADDISFLSDEYTVYYKRCQTKAENSTDCLDDYTYYKQRYKVNRYNSTVIQYSSSLAFFYNQYNDCVIWDKKNWQCKTIYSDSQEIRGIHNGRYNYGIYYNSKAIEPSVNHYYTQDISIISYYTYLLTTGARQ